MAACCGQHACASLGFLGKGDLVGPLQALHSEVDLSKGDVKLDSRDIPTCLMVQIRAFKMDIFWKGTRYTLE